MSFSDYLGQLGLPYWSRQQLVAVVVTLALLSYRYLAVGRAVILSRAGRRLGHLSPAWPLVLEGCVRVCPILWLGMAWWRQVGLAVPRPYLDEVFHIPQAQAYCQGRWSHWDDKITTPPGLYLFSLPLDPSMSCGVGRLRVVNVVAICLIVLVARCCRAALARPEADLVRHSSVLTDHTAYNICLLPILFFFTGLFYTDVTSTLFLLLAYLDHHLRIRRARKARKVRKGALALGPALRRDVLTVLLGLWALAFRQTNVFWVVVYMGGLEAVDAIKGLEPRPVEPPPPDSERQPRIRAVSQMTSFHLQRFSRGEVHDLPLHEAWPVDICLTVISLGTAVVCNPRVVVGRVRPHLVILACFLTFVYWNGGVVLGDRSNHVATLHLAQMLYIWPVFTFFAAPLMIPQLFRALSNVLNVSNVFNVFNVFNVYSLLKPKHSSSGGSAGTGHPQSTVMESKETGDAKRQEARTRTRCLRIGESITLAGVGTALAIAHFNTIIHPFTLADNRHYMFYIFRYTVLRHPAVRYLLVPVHLFCAWLCWATLHRRPPIDAVAVAGDEHGPGPSSRKKIPGPSPSTMPSTKALKISECRGISNESDAGDLTGQQQPLEDDTGAPVTSTVLILLLATALSLISAPLVEPRYFIPPYVFWRLLVPTWPTFTQSERARMGSTLPPKLRWLVDYLDGVDVRLVVESIWLLAVNLLTMYIFIKRPFVWYGPDGELLDEGKPQRFMW